MKKKVVITFILLALFGVIGIAASHPSLGRSPRGERLERINKSPNYRDGKFQNLNPTPQLTTDKSKLRTMFEFLFEKREGTRPDVQIPAIKSDLKSLPIDSNVVVWFGHSSYYLQIDGKRILVDPVFYHAAPLAFINKPFKKTNIYKPDDMPDIDYLIITHDHWDHLDYKTAKKLKGRVEKVICPLGVGEHFERWGYKPEELIELDWNENEKLADDMEVYCLPARHFSGRSFKGNQTLWASYMLQLPSQNIFIGGDSGYGNHYRNIGERFPSIDLALLENGQYNENWRYIHHLPEDLLKVIDELKPKAIIAGHNSKYALAKHSWKEPLDYIYEASKNGNFILLTPLIGEIVLFNQTNQTGKWW